MSNSKKFVIAAATLVTVVATNDSARAEPAYCNPYGFAACVTSTYCEWPVAYQCRSIALSNCGSAAPHYGFGSYCTFSMECFPDDMIVCLVGES
jgi:hypothetical protein